MALERAVTKVRSELEARGLLLLHDRVLPSVTTIVAGEPITGSWWGHEQGALIWHTLQVVDDEVATAKLVSGKVTFLHRRLWPALAAVGNEGATWQWRGLGDRERGLIDRLADARQLRTDALLDHLEGHERKEMKRAIDQLDKRLLSYTEQVHTDSGKHARILTTWPHFIAQRALEPPSAERGREALEQCVASWPRDEKKQLLPWTPRANGPRAPTNGHE